MEDIAASTGLFPLASGAEEAVCDFRLEGIAGLFPAETVGVGEVARTGAVTLGCGWVNWTAGAF
jgi:hypothetical protein